MQRRLVHPLLVFITSCSCAFAQEVSRTAVAPRIVISLPHNIPPEVIWVRYALYGPKGDGGRISKGDRLEAEPHFRHYISTMFDGGAARYAKVVVYAPGCDFATYDLDLGSSSDISERFQCKPLRTKTVHGFLDPKEIPYNPYRAEKKLDVAGYLDGLWVCDLFLEPPRTSQAITEAGSCLGSDIPLGMVGEINPGYGGRFDITIPDFTRDPVFDRFEKHGGFGVIELALKDTQFGQTLATITAEKGPKWGLNVQSAYHDPVIFTRVPNPR